MPYHRARSTVKRLWGGSLTALCLIVGAPASAADLSVSGFGTLGYARSDQPFSYQRFIDDNGSLRRDSVVGVQLDARLGGGFGATVQAKAAAAVGADRRTDATLAWAFLSYRPSNDWLFRLGKQRIPLYLYSENYDVGATFDFARLPTEMYSISPSNDFIGGSVGKTWRVANGEIALDAYVGQSNTKFRFWLRDALPGQNAGGVFGDLKMKGGGVVLSYKEEGRSLRVGLLRAKLKAERAFAATFPFVELAPGVGYFQVDESLPGPGIPLNTHIYNTTLTVGAEVALPANFRGIAEFSRSVVPNDDVGPKGNRGHVSLLRGIGDWTPYVSYGFLRSPARQVSFYGRVNDNTLPPAVPGAQLINASQRAGADQLLVFDQSSRAIGTSYSISASSKLKAEYARTRIGDVSSLVDALPGTTVRNTTIDVWSLSYSVVF